MVGENCYVRIMAAFLPSVTVDTRQRTDEIERPSADGVAKAVNDSDTDKRVEIEVNQFRRIKEEQMTVKHFCMEKGCSSHSRPFKTFATLKQHYMTMHGKKVFSCKKCNKLFLEVGKRNSHESECGILFVCSCGIAYHGKRGLVTHLKVSKHACPTALKEYFELKKIKRPKKDRKIIATKRKGLAPILPKGGFFQPTLDILATHPTNALILHPVGKSQSVCSQSVSKLPLPKLPIKGLHKVTKNSSHGRPCTFTIKVIRPPQTNPECNFQSISSTPCLNLAVNSPTKQALIEAQPGGLVGIKSKTSQTDWSVGNQAAQDFSCQTDEFLAWLDTESAKCNPNQSKGESSRSNICTQTLQTHSQNIFSEENAFGVVRSVAQIETQTEDDWISALLQESEILTNEVSNTESQTPVILYPSQGMSFNDNGNNNCKPLHIVPEVTNLGCSMQTQTGFEESMSHVTTQTIPDSETGIGTSPSYFLNFSNNTQTQTENILVPDTLFATANTQTSFQSEGSLLTEFFNIETQTESSPVGRSASAQTQTLF